MDVCVNRLSVCLQWIPPPPPLAEQRLEEEIALDLGDEYESALGEANENELVDLAGKRREAEKLES